MHVVLALETLKMTYVKNVNGESYIDAEGNIVLHGQPVEFADLEVA